MPVNKSAHHPAQAQGTGSNDVCYWPSKHSMSRGERDDLDNHLCGMGGDAGEAQLKLLCWGPPAWSCRQATTNRLVHSTKMMIMHMICALLVARYSGRGERQGFVTLSQVFVGRPWKPEIAAKVLSPAQMCGAAATCGDLPALEFLENKCGKSGNNYLLIMMDLTGKRRGLFPPREKVGGEGLSHFLGNEPLKHTTHNWVPAYYQVG